MPRGALLAVGIGNSVTVPAGVMRPILLALASVNQRLPSGPGVIQKGLPFGSIPVENSCPSARVVIRPTLPTSSANHRLPSGPLAIPRRLLWVLIPEPVDQSVTLPSGVMRPTRLPEYAVN